MNTFLSKGFCYSSQQHCVTYLDISSQSRPVNFKSLCSDDYADVISHHNPGEGSVACFGMINQNYISLFHRAKFKQFHIWSQQNPQGASVSQTVVYIQAVDHFNRV